MMSILHLSQKRVRLFILTQVGCVGGILWFVFASDSPEALSFIELILALNFAAFTRWILRPILVRRWTYFEDKHCAPYVLGFMVLFTLCAPLLILKLEPVAEHIANVAYFLLCIGVGVEIVQVRRGKVDTINTT